MEIRSESRIHHPRDVVFAAYRDRLPEIAAYIPDIKEIVVESREQADGIVELHNVWVSDREIPSFARAILEPEYLRWDDFATWRNAEWACDWSIRTRAFTDAVVCGGRNQFFEDGRGTRVLLSGDLTIRLKEIPGVPKFLAPRIAPQVEKFIVSLITPNLEAVNRSLQRFLDDRK
jgi:nitrogen fixation protein